MSVTTGVGIVRQTTSSAESSLATRTRTTSGFETNDFAYNKSATNAFPHRIHRAIFGTRHAAARTAFHVLQPKRLPSSGVSRPSLLGIYTAMAASSSQSVHVHKALSVSNRSARAICQLPFPSHDHGRATEDRRLPDVAGRADRRARAGSWTRCKAHKKGLMQQLFPREGETLPRLRFPEFRRRGSGEDEAARSHVVRDGHQASMDGRDRRDSMESRYRSTWRSMSTQVGLRD